MRNGCDGWPSASCVQKTRLQSRPATPQCPATPAASAASATPRRSRAPWRRSRPATSSSRPIRIVSAAAASACVSAPVRRREQEHARAVVGEASQVHELGPPRQRAHREPVPHRLPERREVGRDAEQALRAVRAPPEPGDHLVEHEHDAPRPTQRGDGAEVGARVLPAPHGLHHHARDPGGVWRSRRSRSAPGSPYGNDTVRSRTAAGTPAPSGVRPINQVVLGQERVVAADGDELAAGRGAGQPHGGRRRRRPVLAELDALGAWDEVEERFGRLELDARRAAEAGAPPEPLGRRRRHARLGVAQDHRAEALPRTRRTRSRRGPTRAPPPPARRRPAWPGASGRRLWRRCGRRRGSRGAPGAGGRGWRRSG